MTTLLAFLVTLGVLITIHEYGHYRVARLCGVKVLQFSIGFGRALYTRKTGKDGTEFILAAFPLGGYVRMLDEREAPVPEHELHRAFNRQAIWKRMLVVLAGPIANLTLAVALYWLLFMVGVSGIKPVVGEIAPDTAAAKAGMVAGETVRAIGSEPVNSWQDMRWEVLRQSLKSGAVEVVTDGGRYQLDVSSLLHDDPTRDLFDQLGLKQYLPAIPAEVGEVIAGSPADKGGLKKGDKITAVGDSPIAEWVEFFNIVRAHPGQPLVIKIERDGQSLALAITPESVQEGGKIMGRIGAGVESMSEGKAEKLLAAHGLLVETRYAPGSALIHALDKSWEMSVFSLKMMWRMVTGVASWKGIGGPITIADIAGKSAQAGWKVFFGTLAFISLSLGILNLLPIPVLDGGHLMYYMIEFLKGSPVSERAMEIGQKTGFALLGLLMIFALYNDINRLITGFH
ncbi:MAG: RIP metalloprotease RseP [Methylobacillus sp.]|jgi:regulator of sigma E protease|nr:RIP metalloprotease RseP [Methylobacillus sp.]